MSVLATALFSVDFWQYVLTIAAIYAIFALGLQLQYGFTGLLNFGHVAFMAIGGYTMALLVLRADFPTWAAALVAIPTAMAFGVLVGLPALRLRADYLAITTIAFGEIIRILILNQQEYTGGPQGMLGFAREFIRFSRSTSDSIRSAFGFELGVERVLLIFAWLVFVLLFLFIRRLSRSPWGRVLRAIREDEDAANALGKNPLAYKLQVMAIGSGIAAIAGMLLAFQIRVLSPFDFEPLRTFFAWMIVLLGGTGRMIGVPVGAVLFAFVFAIPRFLGDIWPFSALGISDAHLASLRLIVVGVILIAIMALRPQGLFGKREELLLER